MSGDIQLLQDRGPVDASVDLIRRKSAQLDPNDYRAQPESDAAPAEQLQAMTAQLQMKQLVPTGQRNPSELQQSMGMYPFA